MWAVALFIRIKGRDEDLDDEDVRAGVDRDLFGILESELYLHLTIGKRGDVPTEVYRGRILSRFDR